MGRKREKIGGDDLRKEIKEKVRKLKEIIEGRKLKKIEGDF